MDYTDILNNIYSRLGTIISLLEDISGDTVNELFVLLFCVFLVLYIMRGE